MCIICEIILKDLQIITRISITVITIRIILIFKEAINKQMEMGITLNPTQHFHFMICSTKLLLFQHLQIILNQMTMEI